MAKKRPASKPMLETLRERSALFSERATLLSNLLIQAEEFFNEMPGKIEVETEIREDDDVRLSLARVGKGWKLLLEHWEGTDSTSYEVIKAPIGIKAEAAKRLPELFRALMNHIGRQQDTVDDALQALTELPFLDFSIARESDSGRGGSDFDAYDVVLDANSNSNAEGIPDDEIPF